MTTDDMRAVIDLAIKEIEQLRADKAELLAALNDTNDLLEVASAPYLDGSYHQRAWTKDRDQRVSNNKLILAKHDQKP